MHHLARILAVPSKFWGITAPGHRTSAIRFEMAVTADYDAQSAVERELVLRLASLLWRLRLPLGNSKQARGIKQPLVTAG